MFSTRTVSPESNTFQYGYLNPFCLQTGNGKITGKQEESQDTLQSAHLDWEISWKCPSPRAHISFPLGQSVFLLCRTQHGTCSVVQPKRQEATAFLVKENMIQSMSSYEMK